MKTMKVKPWGKNQGDYVIINAEDFDPSKHEEYVDDMKAAPPVTARKKKGRKKR